MPHQCDESFTVPHHSGDNNSGQNGHNIVNIDCRNRQGNAKRNTHGSETRVQWGSGGNVSKIVCSFLLHYISYTNYTSTRRAKDGNGNSTTSPLVALKMRLRATDDRGTTHSDGGATNDVGAPWTTTWEP